MEEIHHRRGACDRHIQHPGHIEADGVDAEVQPVVLVVEQPGVLALTAPSAKSSRQISHCRPPGALEQFTQVAQAAMAARLAEVGVNGVDDQGPVLPRERLARRRHQLRQPVGEEASVGGRVVELQRIEPGGLARPKRVIGPADGADEDLTAAILVEISDAGLQLARLG